MSKDRTSGRSGPENTADDKSAKNTHYATLRRAHRDAKRERGEIPTPAPQKRKRAGADDWKPPALAPEQVFLYGLHTVRAALANPERRNIKLSTTQNALVRLEIGPVDSLGIPVEIVSPQDIDKVLGPEAIHQGVMLETRPLPVRRLEALKDSPLLLVLDQVTDPHNVGAIMRSAVAFDAGAVITTQRHSPTESGVLAKSASGALELIPYIQITNLADALGELHRLGFTTIGLDSEGPAPLEGTFSGDKIALVLGSEGKGLRQKTRETVNVLARLDMPGAIKSLNVSNAAAIALYATRSYLKS
ncbi:MULTISPECIES: 23S rRNA (guanosine(2251)-2'-O)-methyltransferase RlmB [Rhizobium]|uniref:23S rRNA (Guanosine(2251)-2'-O)-methyltransferase RlmB n=1 Tax=Rhizobium tropici TaxID=398 RepID=A0A329Y4T8_RHITR|nr:MULTISPECIES: 23S rRNA (guanosine(2251)-2'-O)-methyltransferase RlmB [Rhizobium]MBB3290332.1 23S rRNA (guanosine2251-2'-O)-methyltransferase [Rhizobium sp. BK252]MBB3405113.1 23S rRNA (guanosine2251-2'-O)-methyltransferase [Rhizobium sp. BK289]MBB3417659.1 23S rRNA (guanosine2251-2'-O)-methyltransferase [Rhizobium sp. BK284]MBB3485538.1 23S rRNA (guanosine2251-2'-O)-methyltransferase [Rhizobium sp. BK347]MDK4719990.1 23S rRNA (guanosine(2251)-2'-O)-methyltransferase RlmB [Rhizobium sp. CNPS